MLPPSCFTVMDGRFSVRCLSFSVVAAGSDLVRSERFLHSLTSFWMICFAFDQKPELPAAPSGLHPHPAYFYLLLFIKLLKII